MSIIAEGLLRSVHVGRPRQFEHNGRQAVSAIWKAPVSGRVAVAGVNVTGDEQAYMAQSIAPWPSSPFSLRRTRNSLVGLSYPSSRCSVVMRKRIAPRHSRTRMKP